MVSSSRSIPADNTNDVLSNVYAFGSALFFAACAYAQLNDPGWNPVFFAIAYISCGVGPNLFLTSCPVRSIPRQTMSTVLNAGVAILAFAIIFKIITVSPKLELAHDTIQDFTWAFMEHEEGRDTCGLVLLILHLLYLKTNYLQDPVLERISRKTSSSGTVSPVVFSVVILTVLCWAVYMWVVHHPEMVRKYGLKHCQGEMFGRDGSEL
mmetsp:Transcript_61518/g.150573  ORF Transcript_61518/g.150573 Transcript_61518/m.150573 type:complete len:209 (-) Transcript_61518:480-1106(-)